MIKTYKLSRGDGAVRLSGSFTVREFACKDGSDTVFIDTALVGYLQRIRNWAGAPVTVTSGYRTPAHNAAIGGAKTSYHTKGRAADIIVSGKDTCAVAAFAEAVGMTGIERNEDSRYVHLDTRPEKYYWRMSGGRSIAVTTFGGRCPYPEAKKDLKLLSNGDGVRWLQWWLRLWGYDLAVDGSFGEKTGAAVTALQERRGLKPDGIAGEKTRNALKGA